MIHILQREMQTFLLDLIVEKTSTSHKSNTFDDPGILINKYLPYSVILHRKNFPFPWGTRRSLVQRSLVPPLSLVSFPLRNNTR